VKINLNAILIVIFLVVAMAKRSMGQVENAQYFLMLAIFLKIPREIHAE
tara:strand:+ start:14549 stop:14695 length:147 start_codon:yes stop_codon:yes gene_type:complete